MQTGGILSSLDYGSTGFEREADVVVLGAGAGGCAAALALAEGGRSVLLVEEGRSWKPEDFQADTSFAFRYLYQGRGARTLRGNAVLPLPGGRGVGGSTLINSAICFRCPEAVLRNWRESFGCRSLTDERMGGYADRLWSMLGVSVNPVSVQRNNNLIFREGAERLGLKGDFLPRSAPGCVGCGVCQFGCPSGGKSSVDRTLLRAALATGRVTVLSDCRVESVETQGSRVRAVHGRVLDPHTQASLATFRLRAEEVVLSLGPIGTPLFLQANGLSDSPHCGRHLVVHPAVGSLARFPQEIRPWSGVTQGYYVDCWERGFLLQTYTVSPDQYFLLLQGPPGPEVMEVMAHLAHLASAGVLVHDEDSEGAVRWTPAGPDLSYFLGDGDRKRILAGLRLCGEVFLAAGAEALYPARLGRGEACRTLAAFRAALPDDVPAHELPLYASHPMGTCRMGADPEQSVVDPLGRVWGWDNLRVADASLFPSSLGVNPQITTMSLGLLVGDALAGRLSHPAG